MKFNAKYIPVYEPIGDGSRDRGETSLLMGLAKDGAYKTNLRYKVLEEFPLGSLDYVDCYRVDKMQSGNAASSAAVGFMAAGLAGAVVGGLVNSGAKQSWCLEISCAGKVSFFRLNSDRDRDAVVKWASGLGVLK